MIPTVDNYFQQRFTEILHAILKSVDDKYNEPYVIDEALHGYSDKQRDKFKEAFCISDNKQKKPIDVSFAYPNTTAQADALYVVSRGTSEEIDGGIGNTMADTNKSGRQGVGENVAQEEAIIQEPDEDGYYALTKYPILEMVSIVEGDRSVINYEKFKSGTNKFRLTDFIGSGFVGKPVHVSYVIKDNNARKDDFVRSVGYGMREHLEVSAVSTNLDTVRELDSILKYSLAFMRDSGVESNYYQNPKISSQPLGTLDLGNGGADSNVYVITTNIEYTTSYIISDGSTTTIKNIMLKLKPDYVEEDNE